MNPFTSSIAAIAMIAPAFALAPGDAVTTDAIAKAEFLKGDAPTEWKEGELYIIENWATWCGPCLEAIPHIDKLYDTYHEKGLNVIGMNVWEEDKAAVESFVKEKGDEMSYPIAYAGQEGPFVDEWLKAANVKGIPHAFVVKDGELLFGTHPAQLDEAMIEGLLAGGEKQKEIVDKIQSAEKAEAAVMEQLQAFGEGQAAGEPEKMQAAVTELEKIDPEFVHLPRMKVDLAIARKDWEGAATALNDIESPQVALLASSAIVQQFDTAEEVPEKLLGQVREILADTEVEDPAVHVMRARAEAMLGNKDAAAEAAQAAAANPGRMPKKQLEEFAASYKSDDPQTLEDLAAALQAASQEQGQGQ